jgi:hypothetical protein
MGKHDVEAGIGKVQAVRIADIELDLIGKGFIGQKLARGAYESRRSDRHRRHGP